MIKIYTFSHKRPDFLDMQIKSFKKNLTEDFEFIVFNNATFDIERDNYLTIHKFCKDNKIQCIDIEKDNSLIDRLQLLENVPLFNSDKIYGNAVIACAYPLCYVWKHFFSRMDDKICIIDSDMLVVDKINFSENLDNYDLMHVAQSTGPHGEVYYMWNGLVLMNLKNLPNKTSLNWWCGNCEGFPVDVGGHTFYYLKEHKDKLKIKELQVHYVGEDPTCDFSPANYEYLGFDDMRFIWHYRGLSWLFVPGDYHDKKLNWLKNKFGF